jgi:hypothetical protein
LEKLGIGCWDLEIGYWSLGIVYHLRGTLVPHEAHSPSENQKGWPQAGVVNMRDWPPGHPCEINYAERRRKGTANGWPQARVVNMRDHFLWILIMSSQGILMLYITTPPFGQGARTQVRATEITRICL